MPGEFASYPMEVVDQAGGRSQRTCGCKRGEKKAWGDGRMDFISQQHAFNVQFLHILMEHKPSGISDGWIVIRIGVVAHDSSRKPPGVQNF